MNNKGFTLIEVLTAVVILSIFGTITITSMTNVLKRGKDDYYISQENMILMAAKEYYSDHKGELPLIEEDKTEITLEKLQNTNYINTVKDSKGKVCDNNSKVIVTRLKNGKYKYTVKLSCTNKET